MKSERISPASYAFVSAGLIGLWVAACGDNPTEPPTRPPEPSNRPPVVSAAIGPVTLAAGDTVTVDLAAHFSDPDGDRLSYAAESSDEAVATVSAAGSALTVAGMAHGMATITVTASDPGGLSATLGFGVTVPNRPPTAADSIPDAALAPGDTLTIDLLPRFSDPDGDTLSYAAESSDEAVATVSVAGGVLTVAGVARGVATVSVKASDPGGLSAMQTFPVTVTSADVETVVVTPSEVMLSPGDSLLLTASAEDRNGHPVEGAQFLWTSSDSQVATVRATGSGDGAVVRAISDGTAIINAASGGVRGSSRVAVSSSGDRVVLAKLYAATGGPNWTNRDNWLTDAPLSDWYGVDADAKGRVTHLTLSENSLTGPIPPELGSLGRLTRLDLSRNNLRDPIPPELGFLRRLSALDLSLNDLNGPVPTALSALAELREMDLAFNRLTGPIPTELTSLTSLEYLSLFLNRLTGPIPPELGSMASLTNLALGKNGLTGPVPPELGSLANLRTLGFENNELTGEIPRELGNLTNLLLLSIDANDFTGLLPREFLQLRSLVKVYFGDNDGLCAPGTAGFVTWLQGLTEAAGPFCNADDKAALAALHGAAGGRNWTNSDGWRRGDTALEAWYGVTTDSVGRVLALDLSRNGLTGRIPAGWLGRMARMTELRIGGNALSGPLPLELVRLPLHTFHYADTELCTPDEARFQEWLNSITSHQGTRVECGPLSDRDALVALYDAAGGAAWNDTRNWLSDAPLEAWQGIELDEQGRVSRIDLGLNNLVGSLPAELGSLTSLRGLFLSLNELAGPIPSELGALTSLERLSLHYNYLSGPIPAELGALTSLKRLFLQYNQLTGPIPPALGTLTNLEWLQAEENQLTGPIPRELDRLARLKVLTLSGNGLTGPIPPELGNLTKLEELFLDRNSLTGPIPPSLGGLRDLTRLLLSKNRLSGSLPTEIGSLTKLTQLTLFGNEGLSGALPGTLTSLSALEEFQAGGTDLCVPDDPALRGWLGRIPLRRVAVCDNESMAYLTQAAQSREFPVPLVAGKEALLRVFVTAMRSTDTNMPPARATFYVDGAETYATDIPGREVPIPTEIDESLLSKSVNVRIPAWVLQPGLEVVIDVDPDGTLDSSLGVKKRIPETGRLAVDVKEVPTLDLTLIPFLWTGNRDASIIDIVAEMAADHETLLWQIHALLPTRDLVVTPHEPVLSSTSNGFGLLQETEAIRVMEGSQGYYMGLTQQASGGLRGLADLPGKSSYSIAHPRTMVHELGHNLSLWHAPCGGAGGPDPAFPEADGSVGSWGYDFRGEGRLVHPSTPDFMSYCFPSWTSDYDFSKALGHRLTSEADGDIGTATAAAPARSLLLWGGVDADGAPFLEPAFVVEAPPELPTPGGAFQLEGTAPNGRRLFALSFDMPEVADGDGRSGFAFALPVQPEWAEALAAITLTGPDGSATLDRESDRATAILRDPRSGQVRGILRDLPVNGDIRTAATAVRGNLAKAIPGLDIRVSRGIPAAAEWRR